jgi:hypothetical protein
MNIDWNKIEKDYNEKHPEKRGGFRTNAKRPLKYGTNEVYKLTRLIPTKDKAQIINFIDNYLNTYKP